MKFTQVDKTIWTGCNHSHRHMFFINGKLVNESVWRREQFYADKNMKLLDSSNKFEQVGSGSIERYSLVYA